jgi:hypothetical protein
MKFDWRDAAEKYAKNAKRRRCIDKINFKYTAFLKKQNKCPIFLPNSYSNKKQ